MPDAEEHSHFDSDGEALRCDDDGAMVEANHGVLNPLVVDWFKAHHAGHRVMRREAR